MMRKAGYSVIGEIMIADFLAPAAAPPPSPLPPSPFLDLPGQGQWLNIPDSL